MEALIAVIDAATLYGVDRQKLEALVQNRQTSDDDDGKMSALVSATYLSHISNIVDVLRDPLDKTQAGLNDPRHAAMTAAHICVAEALQSELR